MSQDEQAATAHAPRAAGAGLDHTSRAIRLARIACSVTLILVHGALSERVVATDPLGVLLLGYLAAAVTGALVVRAKWWFDSRVALIEALCDFIVVALAMHLSGALHGPFFFFGMLLIISALVRWGWREAAILTAAFLAVFTASVWWDWRDDVPRHLEQARLLARLCGFTLIAALAAWLGRRGRDWLLPTPPLEEDATDRTRAMLGALCRTVGAQSATLVGITDRGPVQIQSTDTAVEARAANVTAAQLLAIARPFLFQLDPPREVMRERRLFDRGALRQSVEQRELLADLDAGWGLVVPVRSQELSGIVLLARIADMSVDLVHLGQWIAGEVAGAHQDDIRFRSMRLEALMEARLQAAQDVHDTVVQALAGTAFRLQALKSWIAAGRDASGEIDRLSDDVRAAQRRVRDYIGALRTDRDSSQCDLETEIRSAAEMASRTWAIECRFAGPQRPVSVRAWLGRELSLLVIEAVSNAMRHGGASEIAIELEIETQAIELTIIDNGRGFPAARGGDAKPWSISRRVHSLGGTLTLQSRGGTRIAIHIPLGGSDEQT